MVTAAKGFGRPLSASERWFWIIDRLSPAHCVARVRLHGQVAAGRLDTAAAALVAEYPLLRMGVIDKSGRDPWLRPLDAPRIAVRRVADETGEAWIREMDAELTTRFGDGESLARITDVVAGAGTAGEFHDIVLTISHIIADGRSLMALLRKLIEYADGNSGIAPQRDSVPPADDLIPAAARGFWRYAYTNLFDQWGAFVAKPVRLPGIPVALPDRRTRIVHRVLDRKALADLASDCRRAGTTVHGAITAAVAGAIGRRTDPGSDGVAGIGSPVDFRGLLHPLPDPDELGIYAPVMVGFVPFGPASPLWTAARAVNRHLARGVRERRHLSTVAGMRFGTPRALRAGHRLAALVDRRAPWNVSVTNLGRVDFPDAVGVWRFSDLTLAASNSCVSVMTVAIATAHDEMRLGFCYVDEILSERQAGEFADDVLTAVRRRPAPSADPALELRA